MAAGFASDGCRPLPPLQKMLMKQQDRLEEREQDIEEQLYKLESDKRLVEVRGASPRRRSPWGMPPPAPGASGFWGGQRACSWMGIEELVLLYPLSPFRPWQAHFLGDKTCLGLPYSPLGVGGEGGGCPYVPDVAP